MIGGYTPPSGSRQGFGALLLGFYDGQDLLYAGRVGTGFTQKSLAQIKRVLKPLRCEATPFSNPPTGTQVRGVTWVEPELVAEVAFTEWTDEGQLRHPVFHGLRSDKPPREIVRERPASQPAAKPRRPPRTTKPRAKQPRQSQPSRPAAAPDSSATVAGIELTNPDRVLYPAAGITKGQLAEFYAAIGDHILPYLVDRPLSVVRCPEGIDGERFFQKHRTGAMPAAIAGFEIQEKSKRSTAVVIHDLPGLIALVQMSAVEFHPWPARTDRLDRPEYVVFDLDPGVGTTWKQVVAGARELRTLLEDLGLESFLRTSGGKGLHVVVPLLRRNTWDQVSQFAKSIAQRLARESPDRYIATMSKARREQKIFIDYLRNHRGATAIASFSTRARPGAPVATPLAWNELSVRLKPNQYTVANLQQRLKSQTKPPWADFFTLRQSLTQAMLAP